MPMTRSFSGLQELRNDLEPEQQVQLAALFWLRRGDYGVDEWDEARRNWNACTADDLIAHPLLANYFEEGLNGLGYPGEDGDLAPEFRIP